MEKTLERTAKYPPCRKSEIKKENYLFHLKLKTSKALTTPPIIKGIIISTEIVDL